jgi:hypothetical protein
MQDFTRYSLFNMADEPDKEDVEETDIEENPIPVDESVVDPEEKIEDFDSEEY